MDTLGTGLRRGRVFLGARRSTSPVDNEFTIIKRGERIELWVDFQMVADLSMADWTKALASPLQGAINDDGSYFGAPA